MRLHEEAQKPSNGESIKADTRDAPMQEETTQDVHIPKKTSSSFPHVPKKRRQS